MKVLFYTHRFGADVVGGAELHLWHLACEMARLGDEIHVCAPLEKSIEPVMRFGLTWSGPADLSTEELPVPGAEHPIRVFRFPVRNLWKPWAVLLQKRLQRRWEQEELAMEPSEPLPTPFKARWPIFLTGWHLPEFTGERMARWTMGRAAMQLPSTSNAALHLQGTAPRRVTIAFRHAGRRRVVFQGEGDFSFSIRLDDGPEGVAVLETEPTWRPLRDTRTIGAYVTQVSLTNYGRIEQAPFNTDHRTVRAHERDRFVQDYIERASKRPASFDRLFDRLRGPVAPGMLRYLKKHGGEYDWVLAGICPFATLVQAARAKRAGGDFRLALLPLFHVDDDYYYWRHYLEAMRDADVNLAISSFSHKTFFPVFGAKSIMAGSGVDPQLHRNSEIDGTRFRRSYNIGAEEKIVLSVSRKSPTKRYPMLIRAIDNIQHVQKCRLILIGPDEDRRAIPSANCTYLGKVPHHELLDAYDACDVFALMSESESFGIVFVEAWMREKPVVGNANCGPVAALIEDGVTGRLAAGREDLQDVLIDLLQDPEKRRKMGVEGFRRASEEHTWRQVAQRVHERFSRDEEVRP